jgi:hypothetical protein
MHKYLQIFMRVHENKLGRQGISRRLMHAHVHICIHIPINDAGTYVHTHMYVHTYVHSLHNTQLQHTYYTSSAPDGSVYVCDVFVCACAVCTYLSPSRALRRCCRGLLLFHFLLHLRFLWRHHSLELLRRFRRSSCPPDGLPATRPSSLCNRIQVAEVRRVNRHTYMQAHTTNLHPPPVTDKT